MVHLKARSREPKVVVVKPPRAMPRISPHIATPATSHVHVDWGKTQDYTTVSTIERSRVETIVTAEHIRVIIFSAKDGKESERYNIPRDTHQEGFHQRVKTMSLEEMRGWLKKGCLNG